MPFTAIGGDFLRRDQQAGPPEFTRALMSQPTGRWAEVTALCETANVAVPAAMPRDLFAAWLEHPQREEKLAAVVFVSLDSEWCVVVPTKTPDR